jgi:hypothetical protein
MERMEGVLNTERLPEGVNWAGWIEYINIAAIKLIEAGRRIA